jgi:3alpha(or 20beta)-hydroxysteroid dehydrogenase
MNKSSLDGKVAIVTGASQGQGEAIARLMAARGAKIVLTDVNSKRGDAVAYSIGAGAIFVKHDVSSERGWAEVIATAQSRFGNVGILVNNAGVFSATSLREETSNRFMEILNVNLMGPFLGMRAILPSMIAAGGGAIVNTTSGASIRPAGFAGAYSASKAALGNLTRTAAHEFAAYKIRVNAIAPGLIDTPMTASQPELRDRYVQTIPLRRVGVPAEVAQAVCFLASDDASFISGVEILIDGAHQACQ